MWWSIVLLAGCGRFGFDSRADGGAPGDVAIADTRALPSGLVAWWPLDDTFADRRARDRSGNGHDASCESCPTPTAGPHGTRAAAFSGTTAVVAVNAPGFQLTAAFTIAVWVQPARVPTDFDSIFAHPFGPGSGDSFQLDIANTGHGEYYSGQDLYTTAPVVVGAWVHLAGTWDGTTKRLFVDGAPDGMQVDAAVQVDSSAIIIGCDRTSGLFDHYLQGAVADAMLFDRVLSDAELAMLAAP